MNQIQRLGFIIASFALVADQASKWFVLKNFAYHTPVAVTSFFNVYLTWNTGITFGLLQSGAWYGRILLVAAAVALSVFLIYCLWTSINRVQGTGFGLACGGAIGNIIDRCYHGAVVDFIDVHAMGHHWYVFNVADACIDVGILLAIVGHFVKPQMIDWK